MLKKLSYPLKVFKEFKRTWRRSLNKPDVANLLHFERKKRKRGYAVNIFIFPLLLYFQSISQEEKPV